MITDGKTEVKPELGSSEFSSSSLSEESRLIHQRMFFHLVIKGFLNKLRVIRIRKEVHASYKVKAFSNED